MTALETRQRATPAPVGPAGRRPPGRPPERQRPWARREPTDEARLGRLASWFAMLFLEVETGQRPRAHLEPLMDPNLSVRLAPVWVRPGPAGAVLRVHGMHHHGVYDAVVIVRRGPRVGALCLRLVHTLVGWRVEEAARPEDGHLPPPPFFAPTDEPDSFAVT